MRFRLSVRKQTRTPDIGGMRGTRRKIFATLALMMATSLLFGCAPKHDDASLTADIQSRFYNDAGIKVSNIQVAVNSGRAILTGVAPSQEVKDRAVSLARGTPGISSVEDNITVVAPGLSTAAAAPAVPAQPKAQETRRKVVRPKAEAVAGGEAPSSTGTAPPSAEQAQPAAPAAPPAPPQPRSITIPSGTHLSVAMIDSVDSSKDQTGKVFRASLDAPIVVDGEEVVPAGTDVSVRLATAKAAGKITGASELELQLVKMVVGGRTYPLVSDSYVAKGKSRGKETATRVGAGAVVGAIVGAIAGGGKGAAIGAAAGAGAGTAVQLITRGQQVKVPAETLRDFERQQPVVVIKT